MNDLFNLNKNVYQVFDDNIKMYFSTKDGGTSVNEYTSMNLALHVGDDHETVINNRLLYADMININKSKMVFCNQTHSINSYQVTNDDLEKGLYNTTGAIDNCDALYTFENNICLNTFHADCTPVYFYSKVDNLIGVIHAGWQGTVSGITYYTLQKVINKHNIDPNNISVIIGPTIQQDSFIVREDVINKLNAFKYIDTSKTYVKVTEFEYKLNNSLVNELQCIALGINHIKVSNIDTYIEDNLFSYRKDNITGRMCASIYQTSK